MTLPSESHCHFSMSKKQNAHLIAVHHKFAGNYDLITNCTWSISDTLHVSAVIYGHIKMAEASCQWKFQEPKMEVLYNIRPYFVGIFPYMALT